MSSHDLVPYESERVFIRRPPRAESIQDSRAHRTTARGHTSHRDYYPHGSERESHYSRRESTQDSDITVRGHTSHHDHYPSGRELVSTRPPRESALDSSQVTVRGHASQRDRNPYESGLISSRPRRESTQDSSQTTIRSQASYRDDYPYAIAIRSGRESTLDPKHHHSKPSAYTPSREHNAHQTSTRHDSHADATFPIPMGVAKRLYQLKEAHYKDDGKTITQRARYTNMTGSSTTEIETRDTLTSHTRIKTKTHVKDATSRAHNAGLTGSSHHHDDIGSTLRDHMTRR